MYSEFRNANEFKVKSCAFGPQFNAIFKKALIRVAGACWTFFDEKIRG
jgi:hypothetical protein